MGANSQKHLDEFNQTVGNSSKDTYMRMLKNKDQFSVKKNMVGAGFDVNSGKHSGKIPLRHGHENSSQRSKQPSSVHIMMNIDKSTKMLV